MANFTKLFRKKSIDDIMRHADSMSHDPQRLKRNLNVVDLTALGIAAIIGAGIFSTIGNAAANGGPAVSLLFVFTALACGLSGLCYARFSSVIPISGSAYTYAYASFGELIAWIIGWDLIMEYAVGNIAVAISWSDYFVGMCRGINIHIPSYLAIDYLSASRGYHAVAEQLSSGAALESMTSGMRDAYNAWTNAPEVFGIKVIADIPAFCIVVFISTLVYIGIRESKIASNLMVALKILILLLIIGVGVFYVNTENWSPFAPNGVSGVLKGVAAVFFAYIGFDAISTTAEECKQPQRDLPRAILLSLLISTLLYIMISLVLTGMAPYNELAVGDPLAYVFARLNLTGFSGLIAVSAVISMASVLLVFQLGQPRIWMSMSRDGLLPKKFSKLHPKYKTPAFSSVVAGILVAIPTLFLNLTEVTDLTSIGTLFAFVLVSGGVLIMDNPKRKKFSANEKGFKIPYFNSRYFLPLAWIGVLLAIYLLNRAFFENFRSLDIYSEWHILMEKIPLLIFVVVALVLSVFAVVRQFSLIPVMGLLTNFYLMTELGITNWLRFLIWLVVGLVLYFLYGYHHSRLRKIDT
ncbi:MAG TPA: amino acid permease [Bacteroidales bacterium]|nr:amino acid permease [Bacteroidales bacterium]HPS26797.1 amino acid permease [Bacteroidales bacterium]